MNNVCALLFKNEVELQEKTGVFVQQSAHTAVLQLAKPTPTGLVRTLIGLFYETKRLAVSSAKKGINQDVKNAVFGKLYICTPSFSD